MFKKLSRKVEIFLCILWLIGIAIFWIGVAKCDWRIICGGILCILPGAIMELKTSEKHDPNRYYYID